LSTLSIVYFLAFALKKLFDSKSLPRLMAGMFSLENIGTDGKIVFFLPFLSATHYRYKLHNNIFRAHQFH
jgi:hypothetical protein